jgi:hypothetical protein
MEESKNGSERTTLPITPRVMKTPAPETSQVHGVPSPIEVQPSAKNHRHRTFTPIQGVRHRYYTNRNHLLSPKEDLKKRDTGPAEHTAKRRQGLLVLSATGIASLGVLCLVFILNQEKHPSDSGELKKGATSSVNFYSGNAAFEKKLLQERSLRQEGEQTLTQSLGNADADIEVSTKEQLDAMKEQLDKVRSIKVSEDEEVASGDAKRHLILPEPAATPRRFDLNNFSAPRELNSVIPKALQGTN